jgi:hypothetical protein
LLLGDSDFELLVALSRADFSDVKYRAEMAEHIVHIGEARVERLFLSIHSLMFGLICFNWELIPERHGSSSVEDDCP